MRLACRTATWSLPGALGIGRQGSAQCAWQTPGAGKQDGALTLAFARLV